MVKDLNFFQKEMGINANIKNQFLFAIRGNKNASHDTNTKQEKLVNEIADAVIDVVGIYKYAQDNFNQKFVSTQEEDRKEAVEELLKVLKELTISSEKIEEFLHPKDKQQKSVIHSKEDFREYRIKGANNNKTSICCEMIRLEDILFAHATAKTPATSNEIVKEQQERFATYEFGSKEPVDQQSDLFLSHLVPTLLTYYGVKVNDSFTESTYNLLVQNDIEIPDALKQLKREMNKRTFAKATITEAKEETLPQKFVSYDIEKAFSRCLEEKREVDLINLFSSVQDLISSTNASLDELKELTNNQNLTDYLQVVWEIENGVDAEDSLSKAIETTYLGYPAYKKTTKDRKLDEQWVNLVVLYSPIDITEKQKQKENAKVETKETKKPQEKAEKKEPEEKPKRKQRARKAPTKAKAPAEKKTEEKPQVPQISYDDAMFDFAKKMFLSQADYDLITLSKFKITRQMKSFDDVMVIEICPFKDVLTSRQTIMVDGKPKQGNLKSLIETYQDIRTSFNELQEFVQKGLFEDYLKIDEETTFMTKAKAVFKDQISHYSELSSEDKAYIDGLAAQNKEVASELEEAKKQEAERMEEKKQSDIRKRNRITQIMDELGIDELPKEPSKEEIDKAISDFFAKDPAEMVDEYNASKKN